MSRIPQTNPGIGNGGDVVTVHDPSSDTFVILQRGPGGFIFPARHAEFDQHRAQGTNYHFRNDGAVLGGLVKHLEERCEKARPVNRL